LMHYTEQVLQSIPPGLPVLLYNIDFLTKTKWHVETVRSLALRYPQIIVGIKDSSGDLEYFEQLCSIKHEIPDFTVLMGPEHLLPQAIQAGADGGVNGGSNVLPDLFVALYQALAVTVEQQQEQEKVYALDDSSEHPFSRLIRGTKCALVALGVIKTMHVNLPFSNPTDEHVTRARDILTKIGYVTP
jgi:2-dehydro-3-deoxy-D-pentonate aldolase